MVARRLRPLRPALHPDDVACRRHLPDPRWSGRRRRGRAAFRAAQQLARQREPRQGSPVALADQEEVRQVGLVGRPLGLGRQRRHGVDGVQDLRLRLRPPRRVGARGGVLGTRGHMARRRALQRGARPLQSARRGADGPDLREPRGAQREPRSARVGDRHPRDVRPHGDERRGDGRPDRRGPHVRQVPWRGRSRVRGSRAGGLPCRGPGHRLAQHLRYGQGGRHAHQRARGRVDQRPDQVGQRVPRQPLQVRLGADAESCGSAAVDAQEPRGPGHRARRA